MTKVPVFSLLLTTACAGPGGQDEGQDPTSAPRAVVDRFSDAAAILNRRSQVEGLPAPGEPVEFDAMFLVDGLGPDGEPVSYYNLDVQLGRTMEVHRIVDDDGQPIADQLPIVTALPGDEGYADFWQFIDHEAPPDYVANAIIDADELLARGWPQTRNFTALNRPLVPEGSTAPRRIGGRRRRVGVRGSMVRSCRS